MKSESTLKYGLVRNPERRPIASTPARILQSPKGQPNSPHHHGSRPQSVTSQRSREKKRQRRSGGGNGKSDADEDVVDGAVRLKRKSSSEGRDRER